MLALKPVINRMVIVTNSYFYGYVSLAQKTKGRVKLLTILATEHIQYYAKC